MKKINTIWISTTMRTGSMWIFNVVRELINCSGFNLEPKIIPQSDNEMFLIYKNKALVENDSNVKFVLKVHTILKENLIGSKIITTIRDPRDVCASVKEFMKTDFNTALNTAKSLIQFYNIYKNFNKNYIIFIRYENIEKNPIDEIIKISKFLDIKINSKKAEKISEKFSKKNVKKNIDNTDKNLNEKLTKKLKINKEDIVYISKNNYRAFDTKTGFQTGHISKRQTGDWEKVLSPYEKEVLNNEFKDILIEFNYDNQH